MKKFKQGFFVVFFDCF